MAFDWSEYLNLARLLTFDPDFIAHREAKLRSAVSRAYYAAFCLTRNYALASSDFVPTGTSADHSLLREHVSAQGDLELSRSLDQLRRWRNCCDYDDDVPDLEDVVQGAIEQAEYVVAQL